MVSAALTLLSLAVLVSVLWEGFETLVLPRRVNRELRFTRLFYRVAWRLWSDVGRKMKPGGHRETFLSVFGPLSLVLLLVIWAASLVVSFAVLFWSLHFALRGEEGAPNFATYVYMSGTTLFTLGYGDVTPQTPLGRALAVAEAGVGFGFLAIVIGYLPVLYGAFSRREVTISLLDARASSPPSAVEMLRRQAQGGGLVGLEPLLRDWERWSAELLESHLSYQVLLYYRSQHDSQSWLGALTAILDTCALAIVTADAQRNGAAALWQAKMTFAMARHAAVDLNLILDTPPLPPEPDRLPPADLARARRILGDAGIPLADGAPAEARLAELRAQYEPFVNALARHLLLSLPPWLLPENSFDNWQTSAWGATGHF